MKRAMINVTNGRAKLTQGPRSVVERACSVVDPEKEVKQSFKDGTWDGIFPVYEADG